MPTAKKPAPKPAARARSAPGAALPPRKTITAPKKPMKPAPEVKGTRTDYEAVERDYRTGSFTDQELATKYGKSRQAITKMAKVKGWKKDLTTAVRQATRAALIAEEATKKVAELVASGSKATVDAVVVAAETNRQVILGHRDDIRRARQLTNALLGELELITVSPGSVNRIVEVLQADEQLTAKETLEARAALSDLMKLPARILSAQRLAQVMGRLQPLERRAFGLDDDVPPPPEDELTELSDEELARRTEELLERRKPRGQH